MPARGGDAGQGVSPTPRIAGHIAARLSRWRFAHHICYKPFVAGRSAKRKRSGPAGPRERAAARADRDRRRAEQASRVDLTIEAVARAAQRTPQLVGPILMSAFDRRRRQVVHDQSTLPIDAWYGLAKLPLADYLLCRMGADWPLSKDVIACVDWLSTMRWGLDHFAYITYLLRSGLTVGAALSARMFLERWTMNVAHHHGIEREEDETESGFITRAWSVYPSLSQDHDMGAYWKDLSEYLHGRRRDDTSADNAPVSPDSALAERIATVGRIGLMQVLGSIRVHSESNGLQRFTATLHKEPAEPMSYLDWDEGRTVRSTLYQMDPMFTASSERLGWQPTESTTVGWRPTDPLGRCYATRFPCSWRRWLS